MAPRKLRRAASSTHSEELPKPKRIRKTANSRQVRTKDIPVPEKERGEPLSQRAQSEREEANTPPPHSMEKEGRPRGRSSPEPSNPAAPTTGPEDVKIRSSQEEEEADIGDVETSDFLRGAGLANSTAVPVRSRTISVDERGSSTERIARILEKGFESIREATFNEGNSCNANRLSLMKQLPEFSGNPLDWMHFKKIFELSSEIGGFADRENISRLKLALRGEARDTVRTLLATSSDCGRIIKALELHFGNKRGVMEKLLFEIRSLPSLESGRITLLQFATKLSYAVAAIKSLKSTNCLYTPGLMQSVSQKLPLSLKCSYSEYAINIEESTPDIVKLSDFLYAKAELSVAAGVADDDVNTNKTYRTTAREKTDK